MLNIFAMDKQLFCTIMQLILIIIFIQGINVQCLIPNPGEEFNERYENNMHKALDFDSNEVSYSTIIKNKQTKFDEISEQFKKIDNDFNDLIEQINIERQSRYKRAVPLQNDETCVVSKTELSDIKTVIDTAMTSLSKANVNCKFDSNKNNNCNELLKLIQCGISNIQNEYNEIQANQASSKQYQNLLNAYETLNEKYLKVMDDVKTLNNQKYKQSMDKLTSDMQNLSKQLKHSNDIILKKTIDVSGLLIQSGKIEKSIEEYYNLMENNKIVSLTKIVENVYANIKNENKENNIKNLLNFIEKIPHKCDQFATYLSLILNMQEENHINCYLSNFWNHLKDSSDKWNQQNLAGKFTECSKDYIENFKFQIQKIIKHIFGNCFPGAENGIQFIDELLTNDQKVIAYPILFQEMKNRNALNGYEIVLLGFRIQEIIITQKSENLNDIMKTKNELPDGVNVLMSSGAIRLKNKGLSDSNFALYNMVTSSCTETVDQYQDWIVRVHQRGRYFQFINVANAHSLRTDERKTFVTQGFCDRHLWEIIPVSNGSSFFIKNKYYGNILGVNLQTKVATSSSNYICHQVQVFNQYTGDGFQRWEIKHKM